MRVVQCWVCYVSALLSSPPPRSGVGCGGGGGRQQQLGCQCSKHCLSCSYCFANIVSVSPYHQQLSPVLALCTVCVMMGRGQAMLFTLKFPSTSADRHTVPLTLYIEDCKDPGAALFLQGGHPALLPSIRRHSASTNQQQQQQHRQQLVCTVCPRRAGHG
jgi:hypothetical protein